MKTIPRFVLAVLLLAFAAPAALADDKHNDDFEPVRKHLEKNHAELSSSRFSGHYDGGLGRMLDALKRYESTRKETLKKLTERLEADEASDDGKDGWEEACERATAELEKATALYKKENTADHAIWVRWIKGEIEQWKIIVEKGGEYQELVDDVLGKKESVEQDAKSLEWEVKKYRAYAAGIDGAFSETLDGLDGIPTIAWCQNQLDDLDGCRGLCSLIDRTVKKKLEALEEFIEENDAEEVDKTWSKLQGVKFDPDDQGLYRDTTRRWKQIIYNLLGEYGELWDDFMEVAEPFQKGEWKADCFIVDDIEPGRFDSARRGLQADLEDMIDEIRGRVDWLRSARDRVKTCERDIAAADEDYPALERDAENIHRLLDRVEPGAGHGTWTAAKREIENDLSQLERDIKRMIR